MLATVFRGWRKPTLRKKNTLANEPHTYNWDLDDLIRNMEHLYALLKFLKSARTELKGPHDTRLLYAQRKLYEITAELDRFRLKESPLSMLAVHTNQAMKVASSTLAFVERAWQEGACRYEIKALSQLTDTLADEIVAVRMFKKRFTQAGVLTFPSAGELKRAPRKP